MKLFLGTLVFLLGSTLQASTTYDSLEMEFRAAAEPLEKTVLGHWGGNCTLRAEPTAYWPAVLAVKTIPSSSGAYTALSYYYERTPNRDFFRNMAAADVEAYQPVKDWFAKEQWNAAGSCHGSLTNRYSASGTQFIRREVRIVEGDAHSRILLRAVRVDGIKEATILFCEFDKALAAPLGAAPGSSSSSSFAMGGTGFVQNRRVSVVNSEPLRTVDHFVVTNHGTTGIILYNLDVIGERGVIYHGPRRIDLPAGANYSLRRNFLAPLRIREVYFTVSGRTENIEIDGYETP